MGSRKSISDVHTIQTMQNGALHLAMRLGNTEPNSPLRRHLLVASQHLTLALLHASDPVHAKELEKTEAFNHLGLCIAAAPPSAPPVTTPQPIKRVS